MNDENEIWDELLSLAWQRNGKLVELRCPVNDIAPRATLGLCRSRKCIVDDHKDSML